MTYSFGRNPDPRELEQRYASDPGFRKEASTRLAGRYANDPQFKADIDRISADAGALISKAQEKSVVKKQTSKPGAKKPIQPKKGAPAAKPGAKKPIPPKKK